MILTPSFRSLDLTLDRYCPEMIGFYMISRVPGGSLMKCKIWLVMSLALFPVPGVPGPDRLDPEVELVELIVKTDGNFQLNARQAPLKRILSDF